ncbi:DUF6702 family protein [uncultured Muriicola sp.]|uniref:DUF6702 family protein n=1 Tax=uncultured Muriicola sp. TaxID=1583102 RepID=UPI002610511D|nr:DUF6702 family protein [uncultured Muriicola sp.]
MQAGIKGLFLLMLPLFMVIGVHKFYVSVTNIEYYDKGKALQITSRVFIDDFEKALEERYDVTTLLGTPEEFINAEVYIEKYLNAKFQVKINGEPARYKFLGKKYDNDIMVCFLEIPEISIELLNSIEIQNELLMDVFEEQKNILHFEILKKKKSFVLIRESNKGMLNF